MDLLSSPNVVIRSIFAGVLAFVLCVAVDQLSRHVFADRGQLRILDDFAAGLVVAFLIFAYERWRRRVIAEKLHTISLMNHHIRNALQIIVYSAEKTADGERIRQSVSRIEWALREILPGVSEHFADSWQPNPNNKRQS